MAWTFPLQGRASLSSRQDGGVYEFLRDDDLSEASVARSTLDKHRANVADDMTKSCIGEIGSRNVRDRASAPTDMPGRLGRPWSRVTCALDVEIIDAQARIVGDRRARVTRARLVGIAVEDEIAIVVREEELAPVDPPGLNHPGFAGGSNFQIGWRHDEQNDKQVFP